MIAASEMPSSSSGSNGVLAGRRAFYARMGVSSTMLLAGSSRVKRLGLPVGEVNDAGAAGAVEQRDALGRPRVIGLAALVAVGPIAGGGALTIGAITIGFVLLGAGIGMAWPHLVTAVAASGASEGLSLAVVKARLAVVEPRSDMSGTGGGSNVRV